MKPSFARIEIFLCGTMELIKFQLQEDVAAKEYFVIAHLRNNFCLKECMSEISLFL